VGGGGTWGTNKGPSLTPSHIVWTILKFPKLANLGVQDGGYQGYYKNLSEFFGVLGVQEGGYQGYYKNLSNLFSVIRVQVVECNLISAKRWCNKKHG